MHARTASCQCADPVNICPRLGTVTAGQPPKRFRKGGNENVHDMQTFIGRGVSNLKVFRSRVWSKKDSGNGGNSISIDELSDVSPTAAAAQDKV